MRKLYLPAAALSLLAIATATFFSYSNSQQKAKVVVDMCNETADEIWFTVYSKDNEYSEASVLLEMLNENDEVFYRVFGGVKNDVAEKQHFQVPKEVCSQAKQLIVSLDFELNLAQRLMSLPKIDIVERKSVEIRPSTTKLVAVRAM